MAATIIGRKACGFCGFGAAHVKQTEGKHPYLHCPECGVMTHAKSGAQARLIVAGMRPEGQQPEPVQAREPSKPTAEEMNRQGQAAAKVAAKQSSPAQQQPQEAKPQKAASWIDSLGI